MVFSLFGKLVSMVCETKFTWQIIIKTTTALFCFPVDYFFAFLEQIFDFMNKKKSKSEKYELNY